MQVRTLSGAPSKKEKEMFGLGRRKQKKTKKGIRIFATGLLNPEKKVSTLRIRVAYCKVSKTQAMEATIVAVGTALEMMGLEEKIEHAEKIPTGREKLLTNEELRKSEKAIEIDVRTTGALDEKTANETVGVSQALLIGIYRTDAKPTTKENDENETINVVQIDQGPGAMMVATVYGRAWAALMHKHTEWNAARNAATLETILGVSNGWVARTTIDSGWQLPKKGGVCMTHYIGREREIRFAWALVREGEEGTSHANNSQMMEKMFALKEEDCPKPIRA